MSAPVLLLSALQSLPEPRKVHGAQGAVVEAVSGLAGFAPNHASVVGAHRTGKTGVRIGLQNLVHIQAAALSRVSRLMKSPFACDLDVPHVGEVNAPHGAELADHGGQIVVRTGAERAGAETEAVVGAVDELDETFVRSLVPDDARQSED